ncbi:hypothetical protein PAALTS15_14531 [Paenibacillus alvei TS-15]|uniref:Pyridoxal-dependent decarboxylase n=2 Tax=Paenibacillus alvei TaxID=44250 RepID=S9SNT1_PAEAL|nr:hypothetical protein PAALTS15_14531 [Paenibacillus alvei TS-15]
MLRQNQILDLSTEEQHMLGSYTLEKISQYLSYTDEVVVAPELIPLEIVQYAEQIDFAAPVKSLTAVQHVIEGLRRYQVHTAHPGYYGLYNPRPNFMGIMADTITAAFNPQLAAWSHAPLAVEIENYVLRELAVHFGYPRDVADGTFTTGGAEANLTAVLTALSYHFPKYATDGLAALEKPPILYASEESHHSLVKAARSCGLGTNSIRSIRTNDSLQMDIDALSEQIRIDRAQGFAPFLIIATVGTTGAGAIDPLMDIAAIAEHEQMWLHVDAAYGGAIVLDSELSYHVDGIQLADSIAFDAHKWLSVPMGAGMYFTRHSRILNETFRITADYMPKEGEELPTIDPYTHSIQWSRRFIGLKLYLSLATAGWEGYRAVLRHQIEMGKRFREELMRSGWTVANDTVLPVICFLDQEAWERNDQHFALIVNQHLLSTGKVWLSVFTIHGVPTLRACFTNYDTSEQNMKELIHLLNEARSLYYSQRAHV